MTIEKKLICQQNKNGKYGFVNEEGKEVIPFIYEKATEFQDGFAMVLDHEQHIRKFIDTNGKIVFTLECDGAATPEGGLVGFLKNNKFGVADIAAGKIIVTCEYDEITDIADFGFLLQKKKKFGIADLEGNLILPCKYDAIVPFNLCVDGKVFLRIHLKNKVGLADIKGKMLVKCEVDDIRVKLGRGKNKGKYRIEMCLGNYWFGIRSSEMDFETY